MRLLLLLFPSFIIIVLYVLALAAESLRCFLLVPKLGSHLFRKTPLRELSITT